VTRSIGRARFVAPTLRLQGITDDLDDHRIIECAVTAGSEYILTHDNDLLRVGEYAGIPIVTVATFLDLTA